MYQILNKLPESEGAVALKGALGRLIADLKPKKSKLLANYPNPFNPDTWIPFVLAKDGSVIIYIHDVNGRLVRKLTLGWLESGYYIGRDKAIYWDGKNESGENVSNGIYFYTIQTGDYSCIRKMTAIK